MEARRRRVRAAAASAATLAVAAGTVLVLLQWGSFSSASPTRSRHTKVAAPLQHLGTLPVPSSAVTLTPPSTSVPASSTSSPGAVTFSPGHYRVESWGENYVDGTRSTPARGDAPGYQGRHLRTVVVAPIGAPEPLPLIVFAEGYDQTPEGYLPLLDAWASAGYLVAAPDLPGLASDQPGTPVENDTANEAQDLSFVTTSLIGGHPGLVDPGHIAAAGHSDGGMAVVTLALDPTYEDSRIHTFLALSTSIPQDVQADWGAAPSDGDLLVLVGDQDEYANYPTSQQIFQTAPAPKVMVTVPGGDHLGIYLGTGSVPDGVREATVAFVSTALAADDGEAGSAQLAHAVGSLPGAGDYEVSAG